MTYLPFLASVPMKSMKWLYDWTLYQPFHIWAWD